MRRALGKKLYNSVIRLGDPTDVVAAQAFAAVLLAAEFALCSAIIWRVPCEYWTVLRLCHHSWADWGTPCPIIKS